MGRARHVPSRPVGEPRRRWSPSGPVSRSRFRVTAVVAETVSPKPYFTKFMSRDPAADTTRTPYSYADNNPINLSDPLGLCDSNPISVSFWTNGNCLSGLVGGPNGGGPESPGGVVQSVANITGDVTAVFVIVATGGAELLPASLQVVDAESASTTVGLIAGGANTGVDCLQTNYSACAWDLDTAGISYLTKENPGGLRSALINGALTIPPNPYGDGASQDSTSTSVWIIQYVDGHPGAAIPLTSYGSYQFERQTLVCQATP